MDAHMFVWHHLQAKRMLFETGRISFKQANKAHNMDRSRTTILFLFQIACWGLALGLG
jgi:hypothetical protein